MSFDGFTERGFFVCEIAFGSYLFLCRLIKREIPGREIVIYSEN